MRYGREGEQSTGQRRRRTRINVVTGKSVPTPTDGASSDSEETDVDESASEEENTEESNGSSESVQGSDSDEPEEKSAETPETPTYNQGQWVLVRFQGKKTRLTFRWPDPRHSRQW